MESLFVGPTNILVLPSSTTFECGAIGYLSVRLFTLEYLANRTSSTNLKARDSWLLHLYYNLPQFSGHIPTMFHSIYSHSNHFVYNYGATATFTLGIHLECPCIWELQGTFWQCCDATQSKLSHHSIDGVCSLLLLAFWHELPMTAVDLTFFSSCLCKCHGHHTSSIGNNCNLHNPQGMAAVPF